MGSSNAIVPRSERPACDAETALEAQIEVASQRMCAAPDRTLKMQYWREMCALIDQRTPHRVRFMARMQGLA